MERVCLLPLLERSPHRWINRVLGCCAELVNDMVATISELHDACTGGTCLIDESEIKRENYL